MHPELNLFGLVVEGLRALLHVGMDGRRCDLLQGVSPVGVAPGDHALRDGGVCSGRRRGLLRDGGPLHVLGLSLIHI